MTVVQNIAIRFTTPAGNTYAFDAPIENIIDNLPSDWLLSGAPVPACIEPDDVSTYRAALAASAFVAQQESVSQIGILTLTQQQNSILDSAMQHVDSDVSLEDYARCLARLWLSTTNWTGAVHELDVDADTRKSFAAHHAEAATQYAAEYQMLRHRGYGQGEIANAIAMSLCEY